MMQRHMVGVSVACVLFLVLGSSCETSRKRGGRIKTSPSTSVARSSGAATTGDTAVSGGTFRLPLRKPRGPGVASDVSVIRFGSPWSDIALAGSVGTGSPTLTRAVDVSRPPITGRLPVDAKPRGEEAPEAVETETAAEVAGTATPTARAEGTEETAQEGGEKVVTAEEMKASEATNAEPEEEVFEEGAAEKRTAEAGTIEEGTATEKGAAEEPAAEEGATKEGAAGERAAEAGTTEEGTATGKGTTEAPPAEEGAAKGATAEGATAEGTPKENEDIPDLEDLGDLDLEEKGDDGGPEGQPEGSEGAGRDGGG